MTKMLALEQLSSDSWLKTIRHLIGGILHFDVTTYEAAVAHADGLGLALTVLFLASMSVAIGQSVILFANRVPVRRFVPSLIGSALVGVVTVLFWTVTIWLVASFVYDVARPWRDFAVIVALGFVPALFGVLLFLPYLGVIFGWVLRIWIFLTILVGVGAVTGLTFLPALVACGGGWLLFELLTRLPLFDLDRLRDWVWRETTGRPRRYAGEDLAIWLAEQIHDELDQASDPPAGATPGEGTPT